jgi:hypothetical protein
MQFVSLLVYVFSLVVWCGVCGLVYTLVPCSLVVGRKLFYCIDYEAVSAMKHIFVMYVQKCIGGLFLWSAEPPDHTYSLHIGKAFPISRFKMFIKFVYLFFFFFWGCIAF